MQCNHEISSDWIDALLIETEYSVTYPHVLHGIIILNYCFHDDVIKKDIVYSSLASSWINHLWIVITNRCISARCNSRALTMELCRSSTKSLIVSLLLVWISFHTNRPLASECDSWMLMWHQSILSQKPYSSCAICYFQNNADILMQTNYHHHGNLYTGKTSSYSNDLYTIVLLILVLPTGMASWQIRWESATVRSTTVFSL